MSPRSTTLSPLCTSGIVTPTSNSSDDISPSMKQSELYCCFSVLLLWPLFFALDFSHIPCWNSLKFFHSLSTAAFASGIFIACGIGVILCTKIVMHYRILSFSRDVFFMNPFRDWLHSLSWGFMGFSNTTESGLCFICLGFFCFWKNGFPCACLRKRSFLWYCSCLWRLQLSPCILFDVCIFFVTRINRINSCQFSCEFEFWFLDCPFLFFSSLSGFSNSCPSVRPYVIWTWCRLDFCQSPSRTTCILLEEFRSRMWISWNLSTYLTDFCFRRPMVINLFFLCYIQIGASWPDDINVFQWNGEWLFFWHV